MSRFKKTLIGILQLSLLCVSTFFAQPLIIKPDLEPATGKWNALGMQHPRRPRVAVVLSGGGARGMAQIGVLRVLEKSGIPIDFIAATSLGAVVGGLYASGYSPAELESLVTVTNWDEVLSFTSDTRRTEMVVEHKVASDRSFLSLRFEGLEPVLPAAVSSGQRLTNLLSTLSLQAVYHADKDFDDLKIRFRPVSTDLITGKKVVIKDGSLGEALRASSTVPLLFRPVEKDSMRLVDGGLVSNIPVDVAKQEGYDIIIAVNTTSRMRKEEELKAPWETADQIMGIMMQQANQEQLSLADVVITPDLGRHLSSDFTGLNQMIVEGERAAEQKVNAIRALYDAKFREGTAENDSLLADPVVQRTGQWVNDSLWSKIWRKAESGSRSRSEIGRNLDEIFSTGMVKDASAELYLNEIPVRVVYRVEMNPVLTAVRFSGNKLLRTERLESAFSSLVGKPFCRKLIVEALEDVLRSYRRGGYSLARVEEVSLNPSGIIDVKLNEGVIYRISIAGEERTRDYVVLREFPLHEGEVFTIEKAKQGITNISGTTLFEYVYLEISYPSERPELTIRLKERPSQLVSLGIRADNERNLQGLIELRDDNLGGTGSSLGLTISGGSRNQEYVLDQYAHRLFSTYLTFHASLFYRLFDSYIYADGTGTQPGRWDRVNTGEYRDARFGGSLAFGAQLQKIGNTSVEFSLQDVNIENKQNAASVADEYQLSRVRVGTIVDSKNSYPFPTDGVGVNVSYEFAFEALGGDVGYNALRVGYESFETWGGRHTLHPKLTVGFADKTMPFGEQFSLGGRESMFGTHEDDRRGRQLLLLNLEYRWKAPIKIVFDTYVSVRYDLGEISEVPEQIKFSAFRHGLGAEIALDTPVGPGSFGVGKSFYFLSVNDAHPIQKGPLLFYFMFGYQLNRQ